MKEYEFSLDHVQALLDVVLGVVIALPLANVATLVRACYSSPSAESFGQITVLLAALLFPTLYWFETRRFISAQLYFNQVLEEETHGSLPAVEVPPRTFMLGSLLMIALAGAAITFATLQTFGWFLAANALFWLVDLSGALVIRFKYRQFASAAEAARISSPDIYKWFTGHATSSFFILYSSLNFSVFALPAFMNYKRSFPTRERAIAACLALVFVLFRHLVWRNLLYDWNTRRLIAKGTLKRVYRNAKDAPNPADRADG